MRIIILFTFLLIILGQIADAKEVRYLARSPRALLMGDAFTALAYDEYSLFYNPAALNKGGILDINPINPDIGITNALDELDRFENFPKNDTAEIASRFMGLPIYLHAGAAPALKFGPIGFSLLASSTASIVIRNAVHPMVELDYRYDRGFIVGYAYSTGPGAKNLNKTGGGNGSRVSIGGAVKHISREGLTKEFALLSAGTVVEVTDGVGSVGDFRTAFGYAKGDAWGADLGFEYAYVSGSSEFTAALSVLDIADTRFERTEGTEKIPRQDMYINSGIAWRQNYTFFDYALAFDIHPMLAAIDPLRKVHIGFEVGVPVVRIMAGWNGGYLSYGVGLTLWPFKLYAGFYGVELGAEFKEQKGSRAVIYISLFDFSFDG